MTALHRAKLEVSEGEWVSIYSEERSGKSTILKIIMGLVRADSGEIEIAGHRLTELSREQLKKIRQNLLGYVAENDSLLPQYSVIENVTLPFIPYTRKSVINERADELFERFGIIHHRGHLPDRLSEFEKRCVLLVRALMNRPPIILFDEPLEGLTSEDGNKILDIMARLHGNGYTLVTVTKDKGPLRQGNRSYFLQSGKLKEAILT
ncbi:MAG: ATP-binding cassette domain-containing protein [Tuberibacillus sp.]